MFSEREASSILRGSGLAGDELHRRRDRGAVVGRVARGEVDAEHRRPDAAADRSVLTFDEEDGFTASLLTSASRGMFRRVE